MSFMVYARCGENDFFVYPERADGGLSLAREWDAKGWEVEVSGADGRAYDPDEFARMIGIE